MKKGPIILIDDDEDDKDIFLDILKDLGISNPVKWFKNCDDAISFLRSTPEQPFIIFCDLNLPGSSGIQCKQEIDADKQLRKKSIPFIFCSTAVNQKDVEQAYMQMTIQGFFQKSNSYDDLKNTIRTIVDYWNECRHPNSK